MLHEKFISGQLLLRICMDKTTPDDVQMQL